MLPQPDPLFPDLPEAAHFDALMGLVASSFTVVPLGEAAARLQAGSGNGSRALPRGALAITFDDGYADNAEVALPILARRGLPATFFVATGFLDGGRMFNDSVIECVRQARVSEADFTAFGLGPRPLGVAHERRRLIEELLPKVKYLGLGERELFIDRLAQLLGVTSLPGDLMMRSDQVVQLHRAGMQIGGHTARHPILRVMPDAEAEAEIASGRKRLQEMTGAPVDVFAYPNGQPMQDYDARHVEMVRRLGFRAAVSTAAGTATRNSDPHQLPRFTPWNRQPWRWAASMLRMRNAGQRAAMAA